MCRGVSDNWYDSGFAGITDLRRTLGDMMRYIWIVVITVLIVGCERDEAGGYPDDMRTGNRTMNPISPEDVDVPGGVPETGIDSVVTDLTEIVTLV